jgi:hypothetical protein
MHVTVAAFGKPLRKTRLGVAQIHAADADLRESQLKAARFYASGKC